MRNDLSLLIVAAIFSFTSTGCVSEHEESSNTDTTPTVEKQATLTPTGEKETTLIHPGQEVPSFSVVTTDGSQVSNLNTEGKVLVLNFFATWCGLCMTELPHFESEIWKRFKDKGLIAVCIGREHSLEEIRKFKQDRGYGVPMAPDPKREVYKKFATKYIPRIVVVGKDGKIKHHSMGFNKEEFDQAIDVIEKELNI